MVRTQPLPLYRECNFGYHGPVELTHYTDFDELAEQQHKVRMKRKQISCFSQSLSSGLNVFKICSLALFKPTDHHPSS